MHPSIDRGVVAEGSVGLAWLGRSRLFRYEVHRWKYGVIADAAEAVDSPQRLSNDRDLAQRVLDLVPAFPTCTWGRDDLVAGEMWNSNSLTSWLLARSGHDTKGLEPPSLTGALPAGPRARGGGARRRGCLR